MATGDSSVQVGPVPFKDVEDDGDMVTALPERPSEEHVGLVSALPCCTVADRKLRCYQGFWLSEGLVPAAAALQRRFEPRPSDVIVASLPKCGTTWLVALAFATLERRAHPPASPTTRSAASTRTSASRSWRGCSPAAGRASSTRSRPRAS